MKKLIEEGIVVVFLMAAFSCRTATPEPASSDARREMDGTPSGRETVAIASDISDRQARVPKTRIDYDRELLTDQERAVVGKLQEAARYMDEIFYRQVSETNLEVREALGALAADSPEYKEALELFIAMKGRWDTLTDDEPFVAPFGPEGALPKGAAFYPPDMTKQEFEGWLSTHPEDREAFQGLFTVIRRDGEGLVAIPYSSHYQATLKKAATSLQEAATLTKNASLKDFLNKRAEAFLTDDYHESDVAWMDLNSSIEVVIGPYEVYLDGLFNYKAAFQAFIAAVDKPASEKVALFAAYLPAMEQHLPIPDEHKNPNRGTDSPIKVVQEIFTAGDARRGVQTAAFNLPNDERVRETKGSKKVLLKNVMEAKFHNIGHPIAMRVLEEPQATQLSFDAFFTHVLFHELAHGLGPGIITDADGNRVECRFLLEELYSTIEEAKADTLGVWNVLYAMEQGLIDSFSREQLFATDVGTMFRSMRFGIGEAHGGGVAAQWNWYREKGAIMPAGEGRFRIDMEKMPGAVESLGHELLMIEATGDYDRARRFLETYGIATDEIKTTLATLTDIPVDITPVFVAAGEK